MRTFKMLGIFGGIFALYICSYAFWYSHRLNVGPKKNPPTTKADWLIIVPMRTVGDKVLSGIYLPLVLCDSLRFGGFVFGSDPSPFGPTWDNVQQLY